MVLEVPSHSLFLLFLPSSFKKKISCHQSKERGKKLQSLTVRKADVLWIISSEKGLVPPLRVTASRIALTHCNKFILTYKGDWNTRSCTIHILCNASELWDRCQQALCIACWAPGTYSDKFLPARSCDGPAAELLRERWWLSYTTHRIHRPFFSFLSAKSLQAKMICEKRNWILSHNNNKNHMSFAHNWTD